MGKFSRVAVAALLLLTVSTVAQAKMSKFHKRLREATFALYINVPSGDEATDVPSSDYHFECTATAFERTVEGYKLITAGHCVSPAPDGKYFVTEDILDKEDFLPVTVEKFVRNLPVADFAILDLKTTHKYAIVSISKKELPAVESRVVNVNFTEGIGKLTSIGHISVGVLRSTAGSDGECNLCGGNFMVQLFAGPGASGSAIVDEKTHRIIGILVGGTTSTTGAFCEPMSKYRLFLTLKQG